MSEDKSLSHTHGRYSGPGGHLLTGPSCEGVKRGIHDKDSAVNFLVLIILYKLLRRTGLVSVPAVPGS